MLTSILINKTSKNDFMDNKEILDNVDVNIKLFFIRFVKAVESKNEQELNELICDNYSSTTLMNRNKKDLISFIINFLPNIPLLKIEIEVDFCEINPKKEEGFDIIIKPKYAFKFLWINLAKGVFGRSEIVSVLLEKHPNRGLYCIARMDEVGSN